MKKKKNSEEKGREVKEKMRSMKKIETPRLREENRYLTKA
jgi:hypothetical protein